ARAGRKLNSNGRPLEDTIEEAERVAEAARAKKLAVKLLGGAGIHLHSPTSHHAPLRRKYGDLDYVIARKYRKAALPFFPSIGYEAIERFNLMQADRRTYSLQVNLEKLRHTVAELDVDRDLVNSRLDELWTVVEAQPKPLKWRMRAQVGDRMRWYELPEEVRSPYIPE